MKNWEPFEIAPPGDRGEPPRSIDTPEGIGDRLRSAAFAELQAREAFLWATQQFQREASEDLCSAWHNLAAAEGKHLNWLLQRMQQLGINVRERTVSDQLWQSFMACSSAEQFARFMASAEERGRRAGERFQRHLAKSDPVTADVFGKIAEEEVSHIELAARFFPQNQRAH